MHLLIEITYSIGIHYIVVGKSCIVPSLQNLNRRPIICAIDQYYIILNIDLTLYDIDGKASYLAAVQKNTS